MIHIHIALRPELKLGYQSNEIFTIWNQAQFRQISLNRSNVIQIVCNLGGIKCGFWLP